MSTRVASTIPRLFTPIKIGDINLMHRVVLAPLTRYRAHDNHVPSDLMVEHYAQRSSVPGTLLITEATVISPEAGGYNNVPGIWNDEQAAGWKKVVDAVHANGSYIFCQLWALGRAAYPEVLSAQNLPYVSASPITLAGKPIPPRELTIPEIKSYVKAFSHAAVNAIEKAGFDGVELHNANGYLLDQFLQDVTNQRSDEYGGSIENRARFSLEVVSALTKVVPATKVAIRLSPWSNFQDMGMADPIPQFSYLVEQLKLHYPGLAYIHVVEPRYNKGRTLELDEVPEGQSNDFIREIWTAGGGKVVSAGGYLRENGVEMAEKKGDLIAYGRPFIANPDLPLRLMHDIALNIGDRTRYYVATTTDRTGYTDYPFAEALKVVA